MFVIGAIRRAMNGKWPFNTLSTSKYAESTLQCIWLEIEATKKKLHKTWQHWVHLSCHPSCHSVFRCLARREHVSTCYSNCFGNKSEIHSRCNWNLNQEHILSSLIRHRTMLKSINDNAYNVSRQPMEYISAAIPNRISVSIYESYLVYFSNVSNINCLACWRFQGHLSCRSTLLPCLMEIFIRSEHGQWRD